MKRRKSRRWPPRRRPRRIRQFKRNLTYLHELEAGIIMADLAALDAAGPDGRMLTARDLERAVPGRYDPDYLPRVLRRMHEERRLERLRVRGGFGRGSWQYRIRQSPADAADLAA